ncbi:putative F-box protein At4g22170 [Carex rostrata]
MANWSELPNDILERLTNLLPLPDYHRFGAVCQNWWAIAKQKHHRPAHRLPWLVLRGDDPTSKCTFFNLSENRHYYLDIPELRGHYLCGSSFGWLFTIDNKLNCHLLNPLTRKQYHLPPLPRYGYYDRVQIELVYKAILDRDPSEGSEFKVVIINRVCRNYIALWKSGDLTWKLIDGDYPMMHDVLFFKGSLYAFSFDVENILYVMDDWSDMKITEINLSIPNNIEIYIDGFPHLVDFNGELLLVQMYLDYKNHHHNTLYIEVHNIDLGRRVSFGCKHIEGYAIFLGMGSPVVVDPRKFPSCWKNAIYFRDNSHILTKYGRDLMIYNMDRCKCTRYCPRDIFKYCKFAASIWFNPNPW